MLSSRRPYGFTLIEMLVVIVMLAILLTLALPSYRGTILKSHRSEARQALTAILNAQEAFRTYCGTYASRLGRAESCSDRAIRHASTTDNSYYALSISQVSASGFLAFAVAQGSQANDTLCSNMSVQVTGPEVIFLPKGCWK